MSAGFCWYEHLSNDPERAGRFYGPVLGWTLEGAGAYWVWTSSGAEVGGARELPVAARERGAPAHWLGHVVVDNRSAAVGAVMAEGAEVVGPVERVVEGVGAFTLVRDPQGAMVALSSTERRSRGAVGLRELATKDAEQAWVFYESLLAWGRVAGWELGAELGTYLVGEGECGALGGMSNSARLPGVHPHWAYYADVEDGAAAAARVRDGGGRVVHGPFETPGGDYVAYCEDDQGAAFGLREPRRPRARSR